MEVLNALAFMWPQEIERSFMASVLGIDEKQAAMVLRRLANVHLVDEQMHYFNMRHDVQLDLRSYVSARLGAKQLRAYLERCADKISEYMETKQKTPNSHVGTSTVQHATILFEHMCDVDGFEKKKIKCGQTLLAYHESRGDQFEQALRIQRTLLGVYTYVYL